MKRLLIVCVASILSSAGFVYSAAQYPVRPIRFVIPFPAGGPTDAAGRIIGQSLSPAIGQTVVIDNRAGADGSIGAEIAARAPADGYTLLMGTSSSMAAIPALRKNPPYDPVADFEPVTFLGYLGQLLVVSPTLPVRTVSELIAYGRANPGKLMVAAANPPSVFAMAQIRSIGKFEALNIQYKGDVAAMPDLLTGRVHVLVGGTNLLLPHVKEGKLRALATLSESRTPPAPDVPTMAEAGVTGFSVFPWVGLFAPVKTPGPVIATLSREVNAVLQKADVRQQFERIGFDAKGSTPEALRTFVKSQITVWGGLARESGVPQQ
jgi:tripartite-type tricarboxylate transporter receptor subunit TctC